MEIAQSIQIMKALADGSRLMVLNAVMEQPQCVEELANRLDLAPSTVSFHLKKLKEAGLVTGTKNQYYVIYDIDHELFGLTLRDLTSFENIEKYVQQERIEAFRNKVISTFFKKKRLIKIPSQHKKRLIILEEIARKFRGKPEYTEQEVNEVIGAMHDDYCELRRMLIDQRFMTRQNQVYRLCDQESA